MTSPPLGGAGSIGGGASPEAESPERAAQRVLTVRGAAMVAASLVLVSSARLRRADVRLGDLVRRARSRRSDRVIAAATDLGSMYGVLGVAAALAMAGRRVLARDVVVIGSAAWIVAQAAKTRVERERPYDAEDVVRLIRPPTGSSYPSGHAAVAAATMGLIATHGDRPVRAVARGLVLFVAASRVYVGVHYPSDVLGGIGVGLLLARAWKTLVARADAGLSSARPRSGD